MESQSAATQAALRRLNTVNSHFAFASAGATQDLGMCLTAGEYSKEDGSSVILPEKLSTGKWNVYRSAKSPLKLVEHFPDQPWIRTTHDNFVYASTAFSDRNFLGSRIKHDGTVGEYKWMTYGEAALARTALGSALVCRGLPKGSCVGLYFINRPEWIVTDLACASYSYISVPLYDTLGPDAVKYIINHAEIRAVFCTNDKLETLLSCLSDLPSVRLIVVVGGADQGFSSLPVTPGVTILSYSQLEAEGRSDPSPFAPPQPEDVATICYTSGTTGTPKGAMLTHRGLISNAAGCSMCIHVNSSDIHISYLPLAHIYERLNIISMTHFGVALGFYQGDILKLMDDMQVLRPTLFASVPRLYNRIFDRINATVKSSGGLREKIFRVAYNSKREALRKGSVPSPIWDRLVFNKIRARLGGRVRIILSGASPISSEVLEFLRVCFGGRVSEGYGMTETSCVITTQDEGDTEPGHVGSPNPACEVKLEDVPEMNYTVDDKPHPRGEICVRGPVLFKGYFKDEQQTREMVDSEGWLHTGDIGLWLPGGRLRIIDRKKNIFKLAQGEYIAPEKIEAVYTQSAFVSQCFVYGDSFNSNLVAVVVVDPETLPVWAKGRGIKHSNDLEKLCSDPVVRAAVLEDMNRVGLNSKLRGFEFAKAIVLVVEPFTVENGLLTPTFKIKRPQAKIRFAQEIAGMYADLADAQSSAGQQEF